jgi:hypothetical protein
MKVQIKVFDGKTSYAADAELIELSSSNSGATNGTGRPRPPIRTRPSDAIDGLYRTGFFSHERTLSDALKQLTQDGYNFSPPSILMALKARQFLQRRGARGSYRFVQKFPPPSA